MKPVVKVMIIVVIFLVLFKFLLLPSFLSTVMYCTPGGEELVEKKGYYLAGATIHTYNETTEEEDVEIIIIDKSPTTLKHELIHVKQIERGFPNIGCGHPIQRFIGELEAYSMQWLPQPVFDWIY